MNLTDLQVELRSIENQIARLHLEIEKMKPRPEDEKKADFETITKLAKQNMISNLRISSASETVCKQFVSSLSYLLLTGENDIYERLLYLCRISQGCGLGWSAEEIYKAGLEFEFKDMKELCTDLQEYRYFYLVEAFIIANLSEEASAEVLAVIADIAKLMECDKEEIQVIGQVARSLLLNNAELLKQIPAPSRNRWCGKFIEYVPEEWLEEQRIYCNTICIDRYVSSVDKSFCASKGMKFDDNARVWYEEKHPCVIKKRVPAGSVVKKGDTLLTYYEEVIKSEKVTGSLFSPFMASAISSDATMDVEKKSIIAPCDGIVFYVNDYKKGKILDKVDKYMAVFVVSFFDDYDCFCNWYHKSYTDKKK